MEAELSRSHTASWWELKQEGFQPHFDEILI